MPALWKATLAVLIVCLIASIVILVVCLAAAMVIGIVRLIETPTEILGDGFRGLPAKQR